MLYLVRFGFLYVSRRMRWAGHVACTCEDTKVYKVKVGNPEEETTRKTKAQMGGWDQNGS
jgi:hypothetical protein